MKKKLPFLKFCLVFVKNCILKNLKNMITVVFVVITIGEFASPAISASS